MHSENQMVVVAFFVWFPVKSLMDIRLQYIETLFNPENITIHAIDSTKDNKYERRRFFYMF